MTLPWLGAAVVLLAAGPAPQVYFEQSVVSLVGGKPAGPGLISRVWYAGTRMRMESGAVPRGAGQALILRLDRGKAYRLDPEEKTAWEVDLERLRSRSQMDLSMAGDLMGGSEEGSARTAPMKTRRTIAGHACHGYRITAGSAVMEVWVSRSVGIGTDAFMEFLEWSGANQSMAGILGELRRLPGFPLETRSRVTVLGEVHETLSTVLKLEVGPHPPALFEPPAGYRVRSERNEEP